MLWIKWINADNGKFYAGRMQESKELFGFTPLHIMNAALTNDEFSDMGHELAQWCADNCIGRYYIYVGRSSIFFEKAEDAALIKLARAEFENSR